MQPLKYYHVAFHSQPTCLNVLKTSSKLSLHRVLLLGVGLHLFYASSCFDTMWDINCIYLPYTFALAGVSYIGTARILHCAFLAFFTWYSIVASKNFYIIAWNQFVCFHKNLCWFYEQCQCRHCYVTLWIKCFEGRGVPSSILDRQQQSLVRLGNLAPTLNQMHNILHKAKSIIAC